MELDLELTKAVEKIKQTQANKVILQLPDGLKPRAEKIQKHLKEQTSAEVFIWAGSCFGACDIPQGLEKLGMDLLIQWGHSEWVS